MRLFVSPRSPFVREVLISVCELGLQGSVELVPVVVRMDQPNDGVMAVNPLGKIPALVMADGTAICGSLPIIDALDGLAGGTLLPTDRAGRRWHLRHHGLSHGLLDILVLWRNEREKPVPQQTPAWLANFGIKTAATLDAIERSIPEMTGVGFGLAHVSLAALTVYLDFRFAALDWRTGRPLLSKWTAITVDRASVRAAAGLCAAM